VIEVGTKMLCVESFFLPNVKIIPPHEGEVYTVRRADIALAPIPQQYLAFEEILWTGDASDRNDWWFTARQFRRAKRVIDFSDVLSPKIRWE